MSFRYKPLCEYLTNSKKSEVALSLEQIEKILGFKLPKSASIPSWWSNTPENGHAHARVWVDAGYRVTGKGEKRLLLKN